MAKQISKMNGDGLMELQRKQVFEEELELGSDIGSNPVGVVFVCGVLPPFV
ncbi:hypothetical protein LguiB_013800 [Lonicera macranthoides]